MGRVTTSQFVRFVIKWHIQRQRDGQRKDAPSSAQTLFSDCINYEVSYCTSNPLLMYLSAGQTIPRGYWGFP